MSKIIYAQPIFAPNEELLNKNISSIKSAVNIVSDNNDIKYIFGGWVMSDEYWDIITTEIAALNINATIKRFDKNFGKAYVVNELLNIDDLLEYEYILTCDSDIIFKEEQNYIDRLVDIDLVFCKTYNYRLGVIGLNQEVGNCHMIDYISQNSINYDNRFNQRETMLWNNYAGGIGGGCFFTTTSMWKEVNGYKVMGVYAGDDAYYLLDCKANGGFVGMSLKISIIHPVENNGVYQDWKVKICQRDSNPHKKLSDEQIDEADQLWKSE